MKRALPAGVTVLLVALAPLPCLAYGGWQSTEYGGMLEQSFPILLRGFLVTFLPYALLTVWMEKAGRARWAPLLAGVIGFALLAPELSASGERGPAHLAMPVIGAAGLMLLGLLLCKFVILSVGSRAERPDPATAPGPV